MPRAGEQDAAVVGLAGVAHRLEAVGHVPGDGGAPELRLKSANPDHADYTCLVEEVRIVGKVLWTVRRV